MILRSSSAFFILAVVPGTVGGCSWQIDSEGICRKSPIVSGFESLRARFLALDDEANFWQPSAGDRVSARAEPRRAPAFQASQTGGLHRRRRFLRLLDETSGLAWLGLRSRKKNGGAANLLEMRRPHRAVPPDQTVELTRITRSAAVLLEQPFFFGREDWFTGT